MHNRLPAATCSQHTPSRYALTLALLPSLVELDQTCIHHCTGNEPNMSSRGESFLRRSRSHISRESGPCSRVRDVISIQSALLLQWHFALAVRVLPRCREELDSDRAEFRRREQSLMLDDTKAICDASQLAPSIQSMQCSVR